MSELAKNIQEKYIDEITRKYPIHRFLIFFIILITIHIYKNSSSRILNEISNIKVNFIFDFEKGFLSLITIKDCVLALIFSLLINVVYNFYIKQMFLFVFDISNNLKEYIRKITTTTIDDEMKKTISNNHTLYVTIINQNTEKLKVLRTTLTDYNSKIEIGISFWFCLIYGHKKFIGVDWLVCLALFLIIVYFTWKSLGYYISRYLPQYIALKKLLGEPVEFGKFE